MGMQAARGAMASEWRRPRRNGYFLSYLSSSSHSLSAGDVGKRADMGVELALLAELRPPAPGLSRGEGPRRGAGFPRGPPSAAAGPRFSPAGPYPLTWPWGRAAGWLLPRPVVPGRRPGRKGLGPGCCL